jgi:glycosyltransferase involved in cell wall biosynthesis
MIRYISNYFDTTLITNRKELLEEKFHNHRVIDFTIFSSKYSINIIGWYKIANLINKSKTDLVFMFDDTSPVTLFLKEPVFQYVHQYGDRSDKRSNFLRKIVRNIIRSIRDYHYIKGLQKSEKVFVVSRPIMEILSKNGAKNLVQIPHAVDIDQFKNPKITEFHQPLKHLKGKGYFTVTYTGWVTENRGFTLMLDAIKKAADRDDKIALIIAGADDAFSKLISEFACQYGLENNILNFGIIDVSLIPGILHYSDVCLSFLDDVPAYHVSPPQKIIEYYAAGKPVICNRIEPHEWLVMQRETGIVVNYSADEVADAILELKHNHELLNTMSANAAREAFRYDINEVYGRMVRIMNDSIFAHKK